MLLPNWIVAVLTAVVLVPLSAAADAPRVALHRSEVVGDQSEHAEVLHALIAADLIHRGVNLAPSDETASFLDSRKDKSCMALAEADRTVCLSKLASAVKADRTLVITIAPFVPRKLILSGLVVSRNGAVLQDLAAMEYPRAKNIRVEAALEKALADFVPRLDIFKAAVSAAPARAPEPAQVVTPSPPATIPASAATAAPKPVPAAGQRLRDARKLCVRPAFDRSRSLRS